MLEQYSVTIRQECPKPNGALDTVDAGTVSNFKDPARMCGSRGVKKRRWRRHPSPCAARAGASI
jgi:hypothetical protein